MALWVAAVCGGLGWSGYTALLPGFLLGVAASIAYVYMLYRQLQDSLEQTETTESDLRSGWFARMLLVLFLLVISRMAEEISFPAALFGFFSFQLSLFAYAAVMSVQRVFTGNQPAR